LDQLELALPGRDYYLKKNSEKEIKAYHKYMTEVAQLLGAKPETASEELSKVLHLERRLANVSSQNPTKSSFTLWSERREGEDLMLRVKDLQLCIVSVSSFL